MSAASDELRCPRAVHLGCQRPGEIVIDRALAVGLYSRFGWDLNWPKPSRSEDYPLYMIGYALLLWPVVFLISYVATVRGNVTPDGLYVEKTECEVAEVPVYDSRGPSGGGCLELGQTRYVPIGSEVERVLKASGYTAGGFVLMFGGFAMFEKRKQERADLEGSERERRMQQYFASQKPHLIKCELCGKKNKVPFGSKLANCGKCGEELDLGLSFFEK
jgi:hypothetical protein